MINKTSYMVIDSIGEIYIKGMILYYDKPLVFSCINETDQMYIAGCTQMEESEEWLFVPISKARLVNALKGNILAYKLFKEPESSLFGR